EVTVTFPDGTTATGTADDEGNYTIDIPSNVDLEGGEEIVVTSTDKDGNTSEEATTTVTDVTAPEAPTVNEVTSEDTQISGTAEPGSEVTVTFPDGTTATGTADDQGNYTIDIPSNVDLEGGEPIKVVATDKDGNTSEEATTTVTDTTAPESPTVEEVTSEDTQISGTAEPGSEVTVTFPDGTTATGTADSEGNYTVDIPSNVDLKGGEELQVTATDKNGNVSKPSIVIVSDSAENPSTEGNSNTQEPKSGESSDISQPSKRDHISELEQNQTSKIVNDRSDNSRKINDNRSELPETGKDEINKGTLFGSLFAGLGALLLVFKRRRKNEEDK
ncbi:Ig-like domain-containing protein, partial [Staphylococcus ureilyticus]